MLLVCLLAGLLLRVTRRLPDNSHVGLNGFIIHIALPALILGQLHGVQFSAAMLWPIVFLRRGPPA